MDLGRSLRQALSKFTGTPVADEKAVKALCRELQRVLISSDVNVRLVFELTKKIENRALDSKLAKGLSLREHVVKVVYEELAAMMGERYEPKLKPHKILLLGLYGSGKCVHPETNIPLNDGSIKTIRELYESNPEQEEPCDGGFIKNNAAIPLFSFDPETLKLTRAEGTKIWKLKKTEALHKVYVDNGNDEKITTTPEHPFFVLKNGTITQKRADELKLGDFVAMPAILPIEERNERFFFFGSLPSGARLVSKQVAEQVKEFALSKFGTLKLASAVLSPRRPYCRITAELRAGETDSHLLSEAMKLGFEPAQTEEFVIKGGAKTIRFPSGLTPPLAEFMGYFYGDGNMERNSLHITNEDDEIIDSVVFLGEKLFGMTPKILHDKRGKANLRRATFSSKTLVSAISAVFGLPKAKKSAMLSLPSFFLRTDKNSKRAFLRAYFDCDGYVEDGARHIEFATASKKFAYQLRVLLLSEGITSAHSIKKVNGTPYYRVFLRAKETEMFTRAAGSVVKKKHERLSKLSAVGIGQTEGKLDNLHVGGLLKEVREYFGASIGELQNSVSSYGIYESRGIVSRRALRKFLNATSASQNVNNRFLERCLKPVAKRELCASVALVQPHFNASLWKLKEQGYLAVDEDSQLVVATSQGRMLLQRNSSFDWYKLEFLLLLSCSDIKWGRVNRVEIDETSEHVYDLTVDGYHNFVANNFIVHNTTSAGKLAHFYKSRGLSVGVVACDVDRPAAYEQLEQVSHHSGAAFYGINGEKDVRRIIADAKSRWKEDIIIVDSSGRSAFEGALVEQLKVINAEFAPDGKFLVISADIGQVAGKQAAEFHDAVGLSGVIITKMDGSGKGGGALSAVAASKAKVAFIGVGEKMDALEPFDAQKFVGRLLGFPDLEALMEKVRKIADEEKLPDQEEKLTLRVFYEQLKAAKKLGPLSSVFSMLGAADVPQDMVKTSEDKLKKFETIINSMTPQEREDASLLRKHRGRMARIANGSGTTEADVRELLAQFEKVSGMFNQFKKNRGMRKRVEKMMKGSGVDLSKLGG